MSEILTTDNIAYLMAKELRKELFKDENIPIIFCGINGIKDSFSYEENKMAYRVIADHIRTVTFALAEESAVFLFSISIYSFLILFTTFLYSQTTYDKEYHK